MTTSHGGKRPNAGRKPRKPPEPAANAPTERTLYESAEDYLCAVVAGIEPADPVRVQAAKAILPFQKRRQRVPLAAVRTPKRQQAADEAQAAGDLNAKFKNRVIELATARKKGK